MYKSINVNLMEGNVMYEENTRKAYEIYQYLEIGSINDLINRVIDDQFNRKINRRVAEKLAHRTIVDEYTGRAPALRNHFMNYAY